MSNRSQGIQGTAEAQGVVAGEWDWGWQTLDQENDDGFDAVIFPKKHGRDTGALIFAQVKCGYRVSRRDYPNKIVLQMKQDYIQKHRPRWNKAAGPAIVIWAEPAHDRGPTTPPRLRWADLRDEATYAAGNNRLLLIPIDNVLGRAAIGRLLRMCGLGHADRELPILRMLSEDYVGSKRLSVSPKSVARASYKAMQRKAADARTHPTIGEITFTRAGWRHITRKGRARESILQSMTLMPVVEKMVRGDSSVFPLRVLPITTTPTHIRRADYIGLRSRVVFSHRDSAVVQIVLLRESVQSLVDGLTTTHTYFHSVYELRRRVPPNW